MAFKFVNQFPHEFLNNEEGPFISLYQPTHRHSPANRQDPIVYKNLIKKIEDSLKQGFTKREIEPIMKPFYELADDKPFWNHTLDGLAILANKNGGIIYQLQRPVKELAVVADSFHIKPLIRIFQSADRYQVLGLNRNQFTIYEGDRYGLAEVRLTKGTPTTITEILGDEYNEKYFTSGTYAGPSGVGAFHGHGGKKEEQDKIVEKFFRQVDKYVTESISKESKLPLMLVALDEYHTIFQNISRNPYLQKNRIIIDYTVLTPDKLNEIAWSEMEQVYLDKTKELVESFQIAQSKHMASDDIAQVVRAAWEKRVGTLLIEADRIITGAIDPEKGQLLEGDLDHHEFDDVLDDLAELVLRNKGNVVILPKERMPVTTGVAATYIY